MKGPWQAEASRRVFLRLSGLTLASAAIGRPADIAWAAGSIVLPFDNGERPLVAYPQKRPLILHTARPPQLETPFAAFREGNRRRGSAERWLRDRIFDLEISRCAAPGSLTFVEAAYFIAKVQYAY
jgi:hypothetical protein